MNPASVVATLFTASYGLMNRAWSLCVCLSLCYQSLHLFICRLALTRCCMYPNMVAELDDKDSVINCMIYEGWAARQVKPAPVNTPDIRLRITAAADYMHYKMRLILIVFD